MAKKVYLPKHVLPQAKHFAEIYCELEGVSKSNPAYREMFEDAFYNFCEEAYTHSLTPSGQMGQNPSAHIAKKYYEKTTSFIDDVAKESDRKFSKEDLENMKRRYRMAITTLTHLFLELRMGLQIKTKDGKMSAFQYEQDGKPKDRIETEIAHYMRLFIATIMSAQNDVLFRQGNFSLDKLKGKDLFYGIDFEKDMPEVIARKMHDTCIRMNFVEKVYNAYKDGKLGFDKKRTPRLSLVTKEQLDKAVAKAQPPSKSKPKSKSSEDELASEKPKKEPAKKKTTKKKAATSTKKKTIKKQAAKPKEESKQSPKDQVEKLKARLDSIIKGEMDKIRKEVQFESDKPHVKGTMDRLGLKGYQEVKTIINDQSHSKYQKLYDEAYRRVFRGRPSGEPSEDEVWEIYMTLEELGAGIPKPNPRTKRRRK